MTEEALRERDRSFLALLKQLTLAELMRLEASNLYQADWMKCALDRAIWKAMLR